MYTIFIHTYIPEAMSFKNGFLNCYIVAKALLLVARYVQTNQKNREEEIENSL